ncbi:hypothetical protein ABNB59_01730 [Paenibacillus larvae]|uniref:Uncharacterized protein n=2 Tax=Paenibacillus larvae TaxID=1464 RepID=A0A1U9YN58_9BACL|nr:hypothetical protein [Paenibacillus larvae]AQR78818.1 hypothetical protein BXP28_17670 [Paenibacillus larvae subsp. larvae]AQT84882.1 hypothetical protein B1222_11610 [Paenibacillus larvae subsp. pulvifaciens]AQZ46881.1 hypothetical protein B5S25_10045 [Paenibacillus larvae subsp. pulvifaciens]ARF68261.1 hypothetical protein B7C51_11245 [Paenibacillus larvae subsp. pulvifaciens]AVF24133.1 hypothetical protein ERICI_04460 [Paenibacillus larvae subsp. larvae]
MSIAGLTASAAAAVLNVLDYATWVGTLLTFTEVGIGAAAAIFAYRVAIKKIVIEKGKQAAIQF